MPGRRFGIALKSAGEEVMRAPPCRNVGDLYRVFLEIPARLCMDGATETGGRSSFPRDIENNEDDFESCSRVILRIISRLRKTL